MRRTLDFCWWQAQWWKSRAVIADETSSNIADGVRAYALEQSEAEQERAIRWASHWSPVRNRARAALDIMLSNVNEVASMPRLEVEITNGDDCDEHCDLDDED